MEPYLPRDVIYRGERGKRFDHIDVVAAPVGLPLLVLQLGELALDGLDVGILPREFIEKHLVMPLFCVRNVLTVAGTKLAAPGNYKFTALYHDGIHLFNERDFFEAHEVWEDLWHATHGEARDFIQGLIQVTSALHHFGNGNMRGARLLHDSGIALLARSLQHRVAKVDRALGADVAQRKVLTGVGLDDRLVRYLPDVAALDALGEP